MTEQIILKNFGFVGFGLIGGSIAHALRELYPDSHIIAYNYYKTKPHKKLEAAKNDGILSEISTSLCDFSKCDIIFLCAPVLTNIAYLKELTPYISDKCIITDVGSVKGNIHHAIEKLGIKRHFVGGHPMTGSEKTGYANSDSSYLKNAYYILTPTDETPEEYTLWLKNFIISAGSRCEIMDYETHDRITAAISHAPHLISASLINTVAKEDTDGSYSRLAAGGLKDITRISSSSPEMWQNICLSNPDAITSFLEKYIETLTDAKNAVSSGDADKLMKIFENAKKYRDNLN
ncbi:prephenate dehydrogenase/arogenate dehydrogenase family protein [Eubacterium sp. MSJ-13]|uniref:prephenate dehydrogenase n=1 Tax=Eubacterium sp. MSJ-13 TaxID=2841513 RepID=UPI001C0F55D2|nr:prephenate dehydrogenase/arogenate dehydrogenase family protein [Eubacterium sp. MSJ-13]MBU5479063.1 prephenate dehydrogenase/arogenate dehydrogenase family protein [Eubacterium sp. MSJ-13]